MKFRLYILKEDIDQGEAMIRQETKKVPIDASVSVSGSNIPDLLNNCRVIWPSCQLINKNNPFVGRAKFVAVLKFKPATVMR